MLSLWSLLLLSLPLFLSKFALVSGKVHNIVPTRITPCSADSCLTLSQFAKNSSHYIDLNTTLIIIGENHNLDVGLSVSNISFFMLSANTTSHNSIPVITCNKSANFSFTSISSIHLNSLKFKHCNENRFESIDNLTIEYSKFFDSESPLTIIDSNARIIGAYFLSNLGSYKSDSALLQRWFKNPDQSLKASLGGALIVTHSRITIEGCDFDGNTASFGGAIFSETSSITISSSNFSHNHAKCFISGYCAGGALLIDNHGGVVVINNCTFHNNTADLNGGMVAAFNSTLLISQSMLIKNTASGNGGAVAGSYDSSITLKNTFLYDNQAKLGGGAVYLCKSNAILDNCNILNNEAKGDGGAIYETLGSIVIVNNSALSSNKAQGDGGVLYGQNNSHVVFCDCNVDSNTAERGGVIRVNINSTLYLAYSNFKDNNASVDGGVAYSHNRSVITIKHCNLIDNRADDTGGVVFVEKYSTLKISDCNKIVGNRASYGGALGVNELSNTSIINCNFSRNMATNSGAAVHVYVGCAAAISSSTFNWNEAVGSGAAVYGRRNCTIFISDSTIYNNTAELSGGGVYIGHESYLHIEDCIFLNSTADFGAAIRAHVRTNISIINSTFIQNRAALEGGALHAYRNSSIVVQSSNFTSNRARSGGVCLAIPDCELTFQNSMFINNSANFGGVIGVLEMSAVTVIGGAFTHNTAQSGGVLYAQHSKIIVKMSAAFYHNNARLYGGVIHASDNCSIFIDKITFTKNTANDGGVLSLLDNSTGLIEHSDFISNSAHDSGGAIDLNTAEIRVSASQFKNSTAHMHGGVVSASAVSKVYIVGSNFSHSTATMGAALAVVENSTLSFTFHWDLGINDSAIPISDEGEILIHNSTALWTGGGIYLSESSLCLGIETHISSNKARYLGGGIHAVNSSITVRDTVHFIRNEATHGGGLSLSDSKLYDVLGEGSVTDMNFISNQADYGGALHVKFNDDDDENKVDVCSGENSSVSGCFFHNVSDAFMINFHNNRANHKGHDLFGGLLDRCMIVNTSDHSQLEPNGVARFRSISNITSLDTISSKPVRVCLCEKHEPNCSVHSYDVLVKRRDTLLLPLAAVDQVNGMVTATIHTKGFELSESQATQTVGAACSNLSYHIMVPPRVDAYDVTIYADGPCDDIGISKLTINIKVVNCTCVPGFEVDDNNKECKCNCDRQLLEYNYVKECKPESKSVIRKGVFWISITDHDNNTGNFSYLFFPYCPMDYCQSPSEPIFVNLSQNDGSDAQCANNHAGLLCGKCQPHHSLSLGSSKCIQCHKEWHGLLVVFIIVSLFAGILLVVVLLVLNLTVAVGTLNSVIFYANIMYSNRILRQSQFMSVFISWLNLDVGFDVCFYEGMDAYTKTWLQLVFPAYIIFLVVAIIWISSFSSTFSNLIGKRNPVATLATLILVSYTKFLQTIIITFSFVTSNGSITPATRWLYDASIVYFGWKHAILFCVAVLILTLGLLYTILIFSWQWLLHCPRSKVFNWTRNQKLHSFIDTYHTPHTAKHRYWTGLLLLVRVILNLIAAFSASVHADPYIPLLSTIIVICCLLLFKTVMMIKVYKNWLLNAMDTIMCFNVVIPAIFTLHSFTDKSIQTKVIDLSVGITVVLLWFIIAFHIYRYGSLKIYSYCQNTKLCKIMIEWLSFAQSQEKTTSSPSDGRLLDVLDSLRQDDDPVYDQHDAPTSSVVSLVHNDESPTSDYCLKLTEEENQNTKGNIEPQKSSSYVSTQTGLNNTKKEELSPYFSQYESIRKPLLDENL